MIDESSIVPLPLDARAIEGHQRQVADFLDMLRAKGVTAWEGFGIKVHLGAPPSSAAAATKPEPKVVPKRQKKRLTPDEELDEKLGLRGGRGGVKLRAVDGA